MQSRQNRVAAERAEGSNALNLPSSPLCIAVPINLGVFDGEKHLVYIVTYRGLIVLSHFCHQEPLGEREKRSFCTLEHCQKLTDRRLHFASSSEFLIDVGKNMDAEDD